MSTFDRGRARPALHRRVPRRASADRTRPTTLEAAWRGARTPRLLDRLLDVDVNTYLPGRPAGEDGHRDDGPLARGALAVPRSRADGVRRVPPRQAKLHGLEKKVALRDALRGWIPDQILDAPKRGFRIPLADWFRGELREFARDVLTDPHTRERGYFADVYVREILDRHQTGVEDRSQAIWTLLNFELWHRQFID